MHDFKQIYQCRRSIIALVAIGCITALGVINKQDVSGAIATVVIAIATANAGQAVFTNKPKNPQVTPNKASQQVDSPD